MRNLDEIIDELLDIDRRINRLGFIYFCKGGFNPDQPRVPAGNPHGGQWTGGGGVSPIRSGVDLYRPTDNNQGTRTVEERVNSFGITEEEDRLGLVEESYLFENLLGVAGLIRGLTAWSTRTLSREVATWSLGSFKSPTRWVNQMRNRGWTPKQITDTIAKGRRYPAPNKVRPGNPAVRYVDPRTGRYVVRDEITKEILQVSKSNFKPNMW